MTKQGIWAVFTDPVSSEEDEEYNRWYTDTHLPELMQIEGIIGATRLRVLSDDASHGYLALYHLEGDDLEEIVGRVSATSAAGGFTKTTTLQDNPATIKLLCEQIAAITTPAGRGRLADWRQQEGSL